MKILSVLFLFAASAFSQVPQTAQPSGALTAASTSCTPTSCVVAVLEGGAYGSVGIQLSGTFSATVQFEGTVDGFNWVALPNALTTSSTTTGVWVNTAVGLFAARVRCSAYSSGTISVTIRPTLAGSPAYTTFATFPLSAASAAGLSAATNTNSTTVEHGSRWNVVNVPAVSNQATASKAAGGAGVRHVADCISFSAGATTAPALTQLTVNLRDGATGAGTVIWSYTVIANAATGQSAGPYSMCGLGLVGSTNTAMTLEFSALLTNLFENVSLSGFDVQ